MYGRFVGITFLCILGAGALTTRSRIVRDANYNEAQFQRTSADSKKQIIDLPCPSCAWLPLDVDSDYDDDLYWTQDRHSRLILDFSISDDGTRLQLDGEPIYPSESYRAASHGGLPIYATHQWASGGYSAFEQSTGVPLEVTSFGLVVTEHPVSSSDVEDDADDRVLQIAIRIAGLERQPVNAEVAITLWREGDGELMILSIDGIPHRGLSRSSVGASTPNGLQGDCIGVPASVCRLRHIVESRLGKLRHSRFGFRRPCTGRPSAATHFPHNGDASQPTFHHHGRPHHLPPYGNHYHSHLRHRLSHTLIKAAIAVFIPVMAGITTGLIVSLVGLVVGRTVGYIWIRAFRHKLERQPATQSVRASRYREGKGLLADEEIDPPPVYEHAPAYDELVSEEKRTVD